MKIEFLVFLLCSQTTYENRTNLPWNNFDLEHLKIARKRCGEIYKKSPCIRLFRKLSSSDYSVICGQENKIRSFE